MLPKQKASDNDLIAFCRRRFSDIFDHVPAPGKAELRQEVEEVEEGIVLPAGTAAWISYGLKIEEEQYVL